MSRPSPAGSFPCQQVNRTAHYRTQGQPPLVHSTDVASRPRPCRANSAAAADLDSPAARAARRTSTTSGSTAAVRFGPVPARSARGSTVVRVPPAPVRPSTPTPRTGRPGPRRPAGPAQGTGTASRRVPGAGRGRPASAVAAPAPAGHRSARDQASPEPTRARSAAALRSALAHLPAPAADLAPAPARVDRRTVRRIMNEPPGDGHLTRRSRSSPSTSPTTDQARPAGRVARRRHSRRRRAAEVTQRCPVAAPHRNLARPAATPPRRFAVERPRSRRRRQLRRLAFGGTPKGRTERPRRHRPPRFVVELEPPVPFPPRRRARPQYSPPRRRPVEQENPRRDRHRTAAEAGDHFASHRP